MATTPPLPPMPIPVAYDEATYATLLRHLPAGLRDKAAALVATAKDLYINERHYEVLQVLDRTMELAKATAAATLVTVPIDASGGAAHHNSNDSNTNQTSNSSATGGGAAGHIQSTPPTPLATYLSAMLFVKFIEASPMYVTASRRARDCNELLRDIEDTSGWKTVKADGDGSGTYYRLDKPTGHHYFKVVSTTTANPIFLCGAIMELDLFNEWFPFCTVARTQGDVSRFHKSSHFVIGAPWPFADREAFIEGYGIDDLEQNDRLVIVAHSLYEDAGPLPEGIRPPQPAKGSVRCDIYYGGFLIQILTATTTRVSFIMSIDPKVPNLPQSALNWVSGKILWQMMAEIQRAAVRSMDVKSKYWTRRRERADVYEFLRARYNDILRRRASPEEYEALSLKPNF